MLFPPTCGGCGKLGEHWCKDCQRNLAPLPEPVCEICGEPQNAPGICSECMSSRPPYRVLRSWVVFKGPIRNALHRLKYRRNRGFGETLAFHLAVYVDSLAWDVDTVIPIPLSAQRLAERGYNQVAVVAKPLALLNGWKYMPKGLERTRHTHSQVGLGVQERQENVRGAFRAGQIVKSRSILLMDDVATTGATLAVASQALVDAGARQVYALTIAKALSRYGSDSILNTPFRPLR